MSQNQAKNIGLTYYKFIQVMVGDVAIIQQQEEVVEMVLLHVCGRERGKGSRCALGIPYMSTHGLVAWLDGGTKAIARQGDEYM